MARVLIADDEEMVRELLRSALALDGHEVLEAADGPSAMELVYSQRPEVVLLDLNMPGLRGEQVLIRARELDSPPDVIIITGQGSLESATLAVRYHARDYLPKPLDLAEVRTKVTQILAERQNGERRDAQTHDIERRFEETSRELVRSRGFLQSVLSACADAIIVSDLEDRILLCNEAAGPLCGCAPEKLIGETLSRVLDQGDGAERPPMLPEHTDRLRNREMRIANRDTGRRVWVRASISALRGESGERVGLVSAFHDITESKLLLQELQEANRRLQELSITDSVTGVHNHGYFQERLRSDVQAARRYGYPLSLVLLDLDDFKLLNDLHGHQTGDRALRTVAEVMAEHLRETDVLCRYGGEEFTVILAHIDKEGGLEAAERLRVAIEQVQIPLSSGGWRSITASFGVATIPSDAEEPDGLIEAADSAMYRAKRRGKNQVQG
jgi:two-component system, cell cycle response regulator